MPSELSQIILSCTECNKLEDSVAETVRPFVKPCAHFDIYTNWKPVPVKVAFIAEAPPGNSEGYFYDPLPHVNYRETLRASLFDLLELKGETRSTTHLKLMISNDFAMYNQRRNKVRRPDSCALCGCSFETS